MKLYELFVLISLIYECHAYAKISLKYDGRYSGGMVRRTIFNRARCGGSHNKNMFSGIVEEMGVVKSIESSVQVKMWDGSVSEGAILSVVSDIAMKDAYIGCSISINGVCLTATELDEEKNEVRFGLAPETLRRTNLGILRPNKPVNVERALRADGRNSGHFVQGHVDSTGEILSKEKDGDSLWIKIRAPDYLMKYIVPKGFICIDGTSLTICDVNKKESWFTFMLISHTQSAVIIPSKEVGEMVNIEVDVLAKMVEQSMTGLDERLSKIEEALNLR